MYVEMLAVWCYRNETVGMNKKHSTVTEVWGSGGCGFFFKIPFSQLTDF